MTSPTKPNSKSLLDLLDQQNQIYDRNKVEKFIAQDHSTSSSLLINCLSAIGVIFATGFIIAALFASGLLRENSSIFPLILGTLTLGFTIFNARATEQTTGQIQDRSALKEQLILAGLVVGKFFICWGILAMLPSKSSLHLWALAATMTAVTTLTYCTVNSSINRFMAPFITLLLWLISYAFHSKDLIYPEIAFSLFFVLLLTLALWLHLNGKLKAFTAPLAYAALIFTCTIIPIALEKNALIRLPTGTNLFGLPIIELTITIALTLGFLVTLHHIAKQNGKPPLDLTILTTTTIVILSFFGMQNVLAALLLLTIGYYKFNRPLLVIGIISFIYFLSAYYYSLDQTLIYKSGVLLASGLSFLAAWAYLHFMVNKKGETK